MLSKPAFLASAYSFLATSLTLPRTASYAYFNALATTGDPDALETMNIFLS